MLKRIAILLSEPHAEVNDFWRCVRNLDRIRLDVCHREATLLRLILQSAHKQSTTQGHNVVAIFRIAEWIVEGRAGQTVHGVDGDFQCLGQCLSLLGVVQILGQFAVKQLLGLVILLVLDIDTNIHQIVEILGILTKVVERHSRMRMQ